MTIQDATEKAREAYNLAQQGGGVTQTQMMQSAIAAFLREMPVTEEMLDDVTLPIPAVENECTPTILAMRQDAEAQFTAMCRIAADQVEKEGR